MWNLFRPAFFAPILLTWLALSGCTNGGDSGPDDNACDLLRSARTFQGSSNDPVKPLIINGSVCSEAGSPIVEITLLLDGGGIAICSGTLLTSREVLTAAHCYLDEFTGGVLRSSARVEGIDVPISNVAVHPRAEIPQNDVAVVRLRRDVDAPSLPLIVDDPIESGDIISIYGYGTDEDQNFGTLKSGEMEIIGITAQDIFARFTDRGSNVCFGDSGGPALIRNQEGIVGIVGITSFGNSEECGQDGVSAFSNVQGTSILNFILREAPDATVL